jgi:hypothetical protein
MLSVYIDLNMVRVGVVSHSIRGERGTEWQVNMASMFGLGSTLRPRGRPKNEKKSKPVLFLIHLRRLGSPSTAKI